MTYILAGNIESVEFLLKNTDINFRYHNAKNFLKNIEGVLEIKFESEAEMLEAKELLMSGKSVNYSQSIPDETIESSFTASDSY